MSATTQNQIEIREACEVFAYRLARRLRAMSMTEAAVIVEAMTAAVSPGEFCVSVGEAFRARAWGDAAWVLELMLQDSQLLDEAEGAEA